MYELARTGKFKKDFKKCLKRNCDVSLIEEIFNLLEESGELPIKYKPHKLKGNYEGLWECHIEPDWLLIWEKIEEEKLIILIRTGTHSDLF